MAIESTGRLRAWRTFRGPLAVALLGLVLTAACSGSSSGSGSGPTTTKRPRGGPPGTATPGTRPGRPPTPPGQGAHIVQVPATIDATGRTEVSRQLDALIARVPNGTDLVFRKNGRYRVDRTLYVRNRRHITFDGNGATIFAVKRGAFDRSQIWVKRGVDIVFRNLNVRGVNPNGGVAAGAYVKRLETQHGFRFEGTNGAELDHVRVTDVYGDFVYLGRDSRKRGCNNIWIHDSTFARNGRQGIAVTAATNVIIEHNHFDDTRRSTIDLEPNAHSWHVSNVFVLDNFVGKGRLLFIASHGQGTVDDVVISGNILRGHDLTIDALPPEGERRSNWVITNNVSNTTVNHRPLRFFSIDGLVVKNNTQRVAGGQPGVVLTDDCGAQVAGNDFGSGVVQRHGKQCPATLDVPAVPNILGRGVSSTTTTQPGGPTSRPRPTGTTPTTRPTAPRRGNSSGWLVVGIALVVLIAAAIAIGVRRRRGARSDR